jgi:uncharacterized membrane-anchored protein YjiN (DUF445 family)
MTELIDDYFNNGLLAETFHAERNILIWQHIADEVPYLNTQQEEVQRLYKFIQQSAQTNFVLSLGKIFDKPDKKYPTRCILSFLKLIDDSASNAIEIIETTNTKNHLREFNCPISLIDAVENPDRSLFPKQFSKYYLEKYNEHDLQNAIATLKLMRDKAVAHNEAIETLYIDFETAERLLNFSSELISIFGMAYHSTAWKPENYSFIKKSAEDSASFIKSNIADLKK